MRPLLAEWEAARVRIAAATDERAALLREARESGVSSAEALVLAGADGINVESRAAKSAMRRAADRRSKRLTALLAEAQALYVGFIDRLRAFRVLDPACGSGNFLYLSLLALKDLELRVSIDAEVLGLDPSLTLIGPEAVLGLEINPYAAELARVSVWIGHIQWARRNGFPPPSDPILRTLDTIECRDAVLSDDGAQASWPAADVIVGNPPFLGGNRLRGIIGEAYSDRLFTAYLGQVPAESDFVCYWFAKAQAAIAGGKAARVGLVATNSIRGGANRRVLEQIAKAGAISDAWSDEAWTLDGAAVRVSLVCWGRERSGAPFLDGVPVTTIHSDLTAGAADLTTARQLPHNARVAFQGSKKVGPFEVSGEVCRKWLQMPKNPNGRSNADVLRPSWIGIDVARRLRDMWIVDFTALSQQDAAFFAAPYGHVVTNVKPLRDKNNDTQRRSKWWLFGRSGADFRAAVMSLPRCIVTPEVSKHRIFVWAPRPVLPDCKLMVIARDDDTSFGILHSRFHELWALATGSWHGVGNDPRYTPSTTFETFPFPDGLTPNIPASTYADDPHAVAIAAAARALVEARDRWLNPPELVDIVPEVVPGFPDRLVPKDAAAAVTLKKRTLTALYNMRGTPEGTWLDNLHRTLDEAVAAAYGWPADITTDDALGRLLALNHARHAASTKKD